VLDDSPILLSFFPMDGSGRHFKRQAWVANLVRRLRGKSQVEVGDDLQPNLVHHYSKDEIAKELRLAGFELVEFGIEEYGHAVARAVAHHSGEPRLEALTLRAGS
jgi:hypothetical protein